MAKGSYIGKCRGIYRSIAISIAFALTLNGCAALQELDGIVIGSPALSLVEDGRWIGEEKTSLVSARTAVTVANHRMVAIEILRHDCGLGGPAEKITERVLSAQDLQVDVVSGATGSSKVILKSIERALYAGMGGTEE